MKTALVTGASRGIGRAIALALGARGWAVAVNYRSNAAAAAETLDALHQMGAVCVAAPGDIAAETGRAAALEAPRAAWGRLDLLVNNAGMAPRVRADLLELSPESFDELMTVNLRGPFFLTQAAARWMIDQTAEDASRRPMIINIGSISAYTASTNRGEYCMAKAALAMMTALFADRLAAHHIAVYEVRPGIIATEMTAGVLARYQERIENGLLPIARIGQPEDVANAVTALAEGAFPYATGQVVNIDGGFHLRRL